jgi:hypothetical protein
MNTNQRKETLMDELKTLRGQFSDAASARKFMTAGKAFITLVSKKTGERFTYRLVASEPTPDFPDPATFVGALTGPDNNSDYSYLGRIDHKNRFWAGRKTPKFGDVSA